MKLDFAKYQFELSSLKPVRKNLITCEKILNKIYYIIENTLEKIQELSLGAVFKKDLILLKNEIQEHFDLFITYSLELSNEIEEAFGEIQDFSMHLQHTIDEFMDFLNNIMKKIPDIVGPFDEFKDIDQNYFSKIYSSLDKLRSIFMDIPAEIVKKSDEIYLSQIGPLYYINDHRREKKSEYKSIKKEIEEFLNTFQLTEGEESEDIERLDIIYDKIKAKNEEYLNIIDRINELVDINDREEIRVVLDTDDIFSTTLEQLIQQISETYQPVKKINAFFEELNFGTIFQEDLDLLNDMFYDYFNPLLKSLQEIIGMVNDQNIEKMNNFNKQFQQKIIKTQNRLKEVIEYSIEPFKQINFFNIETIDLLFSQFTAALKKIRIKSIHLSKEVKNILKYLQNIALTFSNKYLTELNDMSSDLKAILKDLEKKRTDINE